MKLVLVLQNLVGLGCLFVYPLMKLALVLQKLVDPWLLFVNPLTKLGHRANRVVGGWLVGCCLVAWLLCLAPRQDEGIGV